MNITDDPFKDAAMQDSLDVIRNGIKSTIEASDSGMFIDEVVMDIDRKNVDNYMRQIVDDQDLEYKLTRVRSIQADDLESFWLLCDRAAVYNVEPPLIGEQKVYFLETSDSAMLLYPIQMSHKKMNIHMETLDIDTPLFLKNMWLKLNKKKSLRDINFVKFNKG